jgi:hypothetical protein
MNPFEMLDSAEKIQLIRWDIHPKRHERCSLHVEPTASEETLSQSGKRRPNSPIGDDVE